MIYFTSFAARMPKDTLHLELKGKVITMLPSQMALSIRLMVSGRASRGLDLVATQENRDKMLGSQRYSSCNSNDLLYLI